MQKPEKEGTAIRELSQVHRKKEASEKRHPFCKSRRKGGPRRANSRPPAGSWLYWVLGFFGGYADAAGFVLV